MLTSEQGSADITGLNVFDGVVITQVIEKLLRSGNVTGKELLYLGSVRTKIITAIESAVGVNIDQEEELEAK
jgi:hypothetical protein